MSPLYLKNEANEVNCIFPPQKQFSGSCLTGQGNSYFESISALFQSEPVV